MPEVNHIFRPHIHFTPEKNWMNDPNGLVYLDGEYHLYYQHNPYAKSWGHMSWGHATSRDLLNWEHLPIAILEDTDAGFTIFSGSAVVDRDNTAGFGAGAMIAIYTADYARPENLQDVHIAYSTDNGRTFQQYTHNPVITTGEAKFGDPKVFWYAPHQKWIMVNICHLPQGHVELYGSSNLKEWTYLSSFSSDEEAPGVWECPDLFPLTVSGQHDDVKWVMKVNYTRFGEGPPATCYFVGDFDGVSFCNAQHLKQGLTSDDGLIYAEVTYNDDPENRRILMGWLRETLHDDRPWTGAMAVPRELTLEDVNGMYMLHQVPLNDIALLRKDAFYMSNCILENGYKLEYDVTRGVIEAQMKIKVKYNQRGGFRLLLESGQEAVFGYDPVLKQLFYVFEETMISASFRPLHTAGEYEEVVLRVFLDQAIIEIFGDSQAALTSSLPFGEKYDSLFVFSDHGPLSVNELNVWSLASF